MCYHSCSLFNDFLSSRQQIMNNTDGTIKTVSPIKYPEPSTGFKAARILNIIKLINEINPPNPSFHHPSNNATSPIPQKTNITILKGARPGSLLGLFIPSTKYPTKKAKQNAAIKAPIIRADHRNPLFDFFFKIYFFNF